MVAAKISARGVQAAAEETVQAVAVPLVITHAEVAVRGAAVHALMTAVEDAVMAARVRRRRTPWINQQSRTRATW